MKTYNSNIAAPKPFIEGVAKSSEDLKKARSLSRWERAWVRVIMVFIILIKSSSIFSQVNETSQLILNWEKLETMRITLDDLYITYKVLDKGYRTIKNLVQGNYTMHQIFFDGLGAVSPAIRNYRRIPFIIDYQKLLVREYQYANNRFRRDPGFNIDELNYLASVYKFLVDASLRNIDDLIMIITASQVQMNDAERMQAIDRIFFDMESKVIFLRTFNNNTQLLAIQRARSRNDVKTMRQLYGVN